MGHHGGSENNLNDNPMMNSLSVAAGTGSSQSVMRSSTTTTGGVSLTVTGTNHTTGTVTTVPTTTTTTTKTTTISSSSRPSSILRGPSPTSSPADDLNYETSDVPNSQSPSWTRKLNSTRNNFKKVAEPTTSTVTAAAGSSVGTSSSTS